MSPQSAAKAALALSALVYVGLGAALLLDPAGVIAAAGITADTPEARAEIRAMYGGLELAIGAWLGLSVTRPSWRAPGLLFVGMSLGGLFLGRLSGVLLEGTGWETHGPFMAIEACSSALGFGLWAWLRGSAPG